MRTFKKSLNLIAKPRGIPLIFIDIHLHRLDLNSSIPIFISICCDEFNVFSHYSLAGYPLPYKQIILWRDIS
ncbi:MAG: hypothetical protein ACFFCV_18745 [Promethearchaeota archaeon]